MTGYEECVETWGEFFRKLDALTGNDNVKLEDIDEARARVLAGEDPIERLAIYLAWNGGHRFPGETPEDYRKDAVQIALIVGVRYIQ